MLVSDAGMCVRFKLFVEMAAGDSMKIIKRRAHRALKKSLDDKGRSECDPGDALDLYQSNYLSGMRLMNGISAFWFPEIVRTTNHPVHVNQR
jgi:hypothetical protein